MRASTAVFLSLALALAGLGTADGESRPNALIVEEYQASVPLHVELPAGAHAAIARRAQLRNEHATIRAFGDTYDLAAFWQCDSACGYLVDTGTGPGPCVGLTYDGLPEVCGTNVFTGVGVEVHESETDNGNGTHTVIIELRSADGSDLVPNNTECAPADLIRTVGSHLGCDAACGFGGLAQREACDSPSGGNEIDPNLPDPPYELLTAKAVVIGTGGSTLLEFDLAIAGQTVNELGTQFTVSDTSQVQITGLQYRYVIATGEPQGACCLSDDSCIDGQTAVECATANGTYQGDFSLCPGPVCGVPANDTCVSATEVTDGVTSFDTTDATLDASAGAPCDEDMSTDIWYDYTSSCTGTLSIDACSGPDTVLQAYSGQACPPGATEGCSDDVPDCGIGGLGSFLELPTSLGESHTIRVGGDGPINGTLEIICVGTPPDGGACCTGPASCVEVSSPSQCPGNYLGDGTVCGPQFGPVVAQNNVTHFETCGSNYNTVLNIFDACGGTLLATNDDCADTASGGAADPDSACFDPSPTSGERDSCTCLATTPGQPYYVQVTAFGGGNPPPGSSTSLFVTHGGTCNPLPQGACCIFGFCFDNMRPTDCALSGGQYQGDNTICPLIVCPIDCNVNGINDADEIAAGTASDINTNAIPDDCEQDLNENGIPDEWEISQGSATDLDTNGIPDVVDILACRYDDMNYNDIPDAIEIAEGSAADANSNGIVDDAEQPAGQRSAACLLRKSRNGTLLADSNGAPIKYKHRDGVLLVDGDGNPIPDPNGITFTDYVRDDELAAKLRDVLIDTTGPEPVSRVKDAKIFVQSCHGGGMLDDIDEALGGVVCWVGGSASRSNEVAHADSDRVADPMGHWVRPLRDAMSNGLPVLQALKRASRDSKSSPMNKPGLRTQDRGTYRRSSKGGEENVTLEDQAAASHHALFIAGITDQIGIENEITRMCELLKEQWGDLNTTGTSVHLVYGAGHKNPCAGSGVPDENVSTATFQSVCDALNTIKPDLGPNEEFVLFVGDHGLGSEEPVNTAGLPARNVRLPVVTQSFPVSFSAKYAITRDPNNQATIRVRASGTYPDDTVAVSVNGLRLGYLDADALNEDDQHEQFLPVPDGLLTIGANTLSIDLAGTAAVILETEFLTGALGPVPVPGWGDANGDFEVDLADVPAFTDCLSGPVGGYIVPTCYDVDIDLDGDVDLADVRLLQQVFTGGL